MSLIDHLEEHLGPIECGWSTSADGEPMDFQIVRCRSVERPHELAYSTLGMSKMPLRSAVSGKLIRQELLILAPESFGDQNIPAVLQSVTAEALELATAYLRGEVIGPRGTLFDGLPFTALYVTIPVYCSTTFHQFDDTKSNSIVFAWLVPITDAEAQLVRTRGWLQFEDVLQKVDPALADFGRASVV